MRTYESLPPSYAQRQQLWFAQRVHTGSKAVVAAAVPAVGVVAAAFCGVAGAEQTAYSSEGTLMRQQCRGDAGEE